MKVIDLIAGAPLWYHRLFISELRNIQQENVALKRNYESIDLDDFYSFTLLLNNRGALVAFSGLQKPGPWDTGVARIASRFRITKRFQSIGLMGRHYDRSIFSGSKYMMPHQMRVAQSLGLSGVFFSREINNKGLHMQSIIDRCNEFESLTRYELHPRIANVCRLLDDKTLNDDRACWQHIAIAKLRDDFRLGLPEQNDLELT